MKTAISLLILIGNTKKRHAKITELFPLFKLISVLKCFFANYKTE